MPNSKPQTRRLVLRTFICFGIAFSATTLPGQELLPPLNQIPFQIAEDDNGVMPIQPQELADLGLNDEVAAFEDDENLELLTRGPLHEAFAVSPSEEPLPGVTVQRAPPEDVNELPPEYEAVDGDESESIWIPGYWAWDEDREDYIWVSGAWRVSPPDRNWIPGYWHATDEGHQWISGFWAPAEVEQLSYVEPPPPTLENGPSIPAPTDEHFWIPGNWVHQTNNYNWNPGRWCAHRDDRVWVPAHYVYTPSGCIYVNGYWDYQLPLRGQLYAPVYFQRPVVTYRPRCEIRAGNLFMHLFVSSRHRHYFFGDYYDTRYRNRGCFPLHHYHHARRRYDPLYSYYRTHFALRGIDCRARLSGWHSYYTRHVHHRPPRTWSGYSSFGLHLATHPHLSRTVLARAPRFASVNIQINTGRSRNHVHRSRHDHLRDLARHRHRLESKNARIVATSYKGQRRIDTRVAKLDIPRDLRTNMPRNSFDRPPRHRHDDAIVDASTLGRRRGNGPRSNGPHRDGKHRGEGHRDRPNRDRKDSVIVENDRNGRNRGGNGQGPRGNRDVERNRDNERNRDRSDRVDSGRIVGKPNRNGPKSEVVKKRDLANQGLKHRERVEITQDETNKKRESNRNPTRAGKPDRRAITTKDLRNQAESRGKTKFNESKRKGGQSRSSKRTVAVDDLPKRVQPKPKQPTVIRANNDNKNSISRRLERLTNDRSTKREPRSVTTQSQPKTRAPQPAVSANRSNPKVIEFPNQNPRRVDRSSLATETKTKKTRKSKKSSLPNGKNASKSVVRSNPRPSVVTQPKPARVRTPKPTKAAPTPSRVRTPSPARTPRTVTSAPRQTAPLNSQPRSAPKPKKANPRKMETRNAPRSVTTTQRSYTQRPTNQRITPQQSRKSVSKPARVPKSVSKPTRIPSPPQSTRQRSAPQPSRSVNRSRSVSPPPRSTQTRSQPSRNFQSRPQPRSVQPRPQPRSQPRAQPRPQPRSQPRSVQRSAPKPQRQRAPKQNRSRSGKKKR